MRFFLVFFFFLSPVLTISTPYGLSPDEWTGVVVGTRTHLYPPPLDLTLPRPLPLDLELAPPFPPRVTVLPPLRFVPFPA